MPFDAGVDGMTEGVIAGASRSLLGSLFEGAVERCETEGVTLS